MNRHESRLRRLEKANAPSGVFVLAWDGQEDREACIRRAGHDPDAPGAVYFLADPDDQNA